MAFTEVRWSPAGYRGSTTILSTFWPEAEHAKLIARWPHLIAATGENWDEHRRLIEQHCVLVVEAGHNVSQIAGNFAEFEKFLKDKRVKKPSSDDLLAYPDLRTNPVMVAWPPARTAPCWCGSGRKYKQCCRPHGLGTLD